MYLVYVCLVIGFLCDRSTGDDNYPNSDEPKPCAAKMNIIEYRGLICVPSLDEPTPDLQLGVSFESGSVDNCVKMLKAECPEFNEASCEWFTYQWDSVKAGSDCPYAHGLQFPVCKLRYKAHSGLKVKTWMEIMYTNQFGTHPSPKMGVDSIVELHRYNYKYANFGDVYQDDWPLSVPDFNSAAGIKWGDAETVSDLGGIKTICPGQGSDPDAACSQKIKDYTVKHYEKNRPKYDNALAKCTLEVVDPRLSLEPQYVCWVKFTRTDPSNGYVDTVSDCQYFTSRPKPPTAVSPIQNVSVPTAKPPPSGHPDKTTPVTEGPHKTTPAVVSQNGQSPAGDQVLRRWKRVKQ